MHLLAIMREISTIDKKLTRIDNKKNNDKCQCKRKQTRELTPYPLVLSLYLSPTACLGYF